MNSPLPVLNLPEAIRRRVEGKPFTASRVGLSGSRVLIYDDCVLKVEPESPAAAATVDMMRWLDGKAPVPRVLHAENRDALQYLLMSRVPGRMACDPAYMSDPDTLIPLLAEGLRLLWAVDPAGCPRDRGPDAELAEARLRVQLNLADTDNAEPDTYGPGGFSGPAELLGWLETHRPPLDPVVSHGDYCLPNIFLHEGRVSGLIDLGNAGVGDRWRDIALCWRSLSHNTKGRYGGAAYPAVDPDRLFDALGLPPDREKLRYYILLDELF